MLNYDAFYSGDIRRLGKVSEEELNFWVMVVENGWEKQAHPNCLELTFLGGNTAHWDTEDEIDSIPDYCHNPDLINQIATDNHISTRLVEVHGSEPLWETTSALTYGVMDRYKSRAICLAFIALHRSSIR